MRWALVVVFLVACTGGEYRPARGAYNDGVEALAAENWERAAEALLRARSEAGVDPELRARAAYNLGLAYAGQAEQARAAEKPDLEQALAHYGAAAGWFQDALRLRPDDAEARTNLAVIRARQQAVADELLADEKALEKRLAALIDQQREIRDRARGLLEAARAAGGSNPVALEDEARALATTERTLLADAGVVADLAGSEIDAIAARADDQLTDEDRVRQVQLGNLDLWMQVARSSMTDTRRLLDEGKLEDAHGRAEEGVESLKRALEQLMDPVAVLRAIAVDELQLAQQTGYLEEANRLGGDAAPVPAWLTGEHLGARQVDARSRLDELTMRLDAVAKAPAPPEPGDPAQARLLERVKVALPELRAASDAMGRAKEALTASRWKPAGEAELEALLAMGRAIEQFVDLRQAIDLAWAEQGEVVAALDGGDEARARDVGESVDRNVGRMTLIAGLLADAKEAAAAGQQPTDVFDQAEPLRAAAETAIRALAAGKKPRENARAGHEKLTALRRLFFSVVEHLQELLGAQGETRDDTTEAAGLDDVGRAPLLPGLTTRQGEHRAMGQAIADALAAQADQATDRPEEQQKLGAAAEEVRAALGEMDAALGELERAKAPDQQVSVDLTPALDAQAGAIDHLEAALRILQPPPPEKDEDPQQQDQQQPQDPQQPPQDQSVERRRERVREQEAQRRREREQRQRIEQDPVEKDW